MTARSTRSIGKMRGTTLGGSWKWTRRQTDSGQPSIREASDYVCDEVSMEVVGHDEQRVANPDAIVIETASEIEDDRHDE